MSIDGQSHFLTLAQGRVHTKIQTGFFLRNYFANLNQIFYESFQVQVNESLIHDGGPMTKMAAMPTYGKNPLKIFSGTDRPISTKLVM